MNIKSTANSTIQNSASEKQYLFKSPNPLICQAGSGSNEDSAFGGKRPKSEFVFSAHQRRNTLCMEISEPAHAESV